MKKRIWTERGKKKMEQKRYRKRGDTENNLDPTTARASREGGKVVWQRDNPKNNEERPATPSIIPKEHLDGPHSYLANYSGTNVSE